MSLQGWCKGLYVCPTRVVRRRRSECWIADQPRDRPSTASMSFVLRLVDGGIALDGVPSRSRWTVNDVAPAPVTRPASSHWSCNYIAMKCRNSGVYQDAVAFCPDVDSMRMRYKLLEEQRIRDIIGAVSVSCLPVHSLVVETI